jgi:hypothetical protein
MEGCEGIYLPPALPVAIGGLGNVYSVYPCSSSSIGTVHGVEFEVGSSTGKESGPRLAYQISSRPFLTAAGWFVKKHWK